MTGSEPLSPDAAPAAGVNQESGLWLWRGEEPPPAEASAPASPDMASVRAWIDQTAPRLVLAARRARWLALPGGLAVVGFAAFATVHLLTSAKPSISADVPAVAVAVVTMAPPNTAPSAVLQPPPELPASQPEAAPAPPAPPAPATAERAEPQTVKSRVSHRVRHAVKRAHAAYARRWAWEACRYQCDWQQPMSWHGGGY